MDLGGKAAGPTPYAGMAHYDYIHWFRPKLDQPLALAYCNVGLVAATCRDIEEFELRDRVAFNVTHA